MSSRDFRNTVMDIFSMFLFRFVTNVCSFVRSMKSRSNAIMYVTTHNTIGNVTFVYNTASSVDIHIHFYIIYLLSYDET